MHLVSVCIPTYNSAKYLGSAIESVLNQTFRDFELIIIDNNSNDGTQEIVTRYNDPRVHYMKNPFTVPMGENWNKCINAAQGKYICILHADDKLQPTMLEDEIKVLESDQRVGFVYSAVNFVDANNHIIAQHFPFSRDYIHEGRVEFEQHSLGNYIYCPSIMVRKHCYEKSGGFNGVLKYLMDWEMWLRIELAGFKVAYLSKELADYRVHSDNFTLLGGVAGSPKEAKEQANIFNQLLNSRAFHAMFHGIKGKMVREKVVLRYFIFCIKMAVNCLKLRKYNEFKTVLNILLLKEENAKSLCPSWILVLALPVLLVMKVKMRFDTKRAIMF